MKKINHKELTDAAFHYGNNGKPVVFLGRTGIGKSYSVKESAKRVAKKVNKTFIEWNEQTREKQNKIIENSDKYYVFVDLRITQMNPEDIKGLPDFNLKKFVEWKVNKWTEALRVCEGTLFLDEINLAPPSLQATLYQVLLDKQVGETPLHPNVRIFGAGNLMEDKAGVYELAKPIRSRAGVYELRCPTVEEWTDYAIENKIDSRVVAFLTKNQSKIFVDSEKTDDIVTPRGWEFVSDMTMGKDDVEEVQLLSSGILGEAISLEYTSFIKLMDKIPSPEEILSKKKKIPDEIDIKYACISSLVEYLRTKEDKERMKVMKRIIKLKETLDPEFYILMIRLCKGVQEDILSKILNSDSKVFDILEEYRKYLT